MTITKEVFQGYVEEVDMTVIFEESHPHTRAFRHELGCFFIFF